MSSVVKKIHIDPFVIPEKAAKIMNKKPLLLIIK
jgi:hypothetical protein